MGATLFDLLGATIPESGEKRLEIASLTGVLEKPDVSWNQDRILMVESGWPQWRGVGGSRFSLRKGHYFVLYDRRPKIFNTLIDRQEIAPLSNKDPLYRSLQLDILTYLQDKGFLPWSPLPRMLVAKLEVAKGLFRHNKAAEEAQQRLALIAKQRSWDRQLSGWQAQLALTGGQWELLKQLGGEAGESLWEFVADVNMGKRGVLADRGCEAVFLYGTKRFRRPGPQECEDELLLSLLKWIEEGKGSKRTSLQDQFLRLYVQEKIEEKIGQWNFVNALNWDVNVETPGGPLLADLLLALPRNGRYASITENRLLREN